MLKPIAQITDPLFRNQWNLKLLNVPKAWELTRGSDVEVGIIDSGVDGSHRDLGWHTHINITPNDTDAMLRAKYRPVMEAIRSEKHPKILSGWNFITNNDFTWDYYRHGTYLAGTIAAESDGFGMVGVAPTIRIRPYVVITRRGWLKSYDHIVQAIDRAVADRCDVINMSLAWSRNYTAIQKAINRATTMGVVVVAATGNNNKERVYYPAAHDNVVAVGGCNPAGGRWSLTRTLGSNYGAQIDCVCPGASQHTTWKMRSRFKKVCGTSQAAAAMTGIVALMKAVNRGITTGDVQQAIAGCSSGTEWSKYVGWGVPGAYKMVRYASEQHHTIICPVCGRQIVCKGE